MTTALAPRRRRLRELLPLLGPAMVAGVAYLDPGNVASNASAGARYGYLLVWVVVVANAMAWLIQYLSAKLGLSTGESLPQLLGRRIRSRPGRYAYWVQAELVAMATDIAEVLGGAIALNLLFGLPLIVGGVITGTVSMLLLLLHNRRGSQAFERVVIGLVAIIAIGFCAGAFVAPIDGASVVAGLVPRFEDAGSVLLAASILGATVMPHAIYAHSALTRDRFGRVEDGEERRFVLRATRVDVTVALAIAGTVNVVILLLAAATLQGVEGTNTLEGAHSAIEAALGPVIATLFAIGLLASGLASTSVGAYAGAEIMQGLLHVQGPAARAPTRDAHPGARDPAARSRPDLRPRAQPGRALVRHPVRAGAARAADDEARTARRIREPLVDDGARGGLRGAADHPQRDAAGAAGRRRLTRGATSPRTPRG